MREGKYKLCDEYKNCPDNRSLGVMTDRQRRPEYRVGQPHFGWKAEDERAEQGG